MSLIAEFQPVDPLTWERKPYFDYYYNTIKSNYTINANVDITDLLKQIQEGGLKFFPVFLYVIMRSINQNKEFRTGFDSDHRLGHWNYVVPSYTIFHKDDHTFSDIWSEYREDFSGFYQTVCADMETYKEVKGIKARPDCPANYCSVSSIPWLSFTGLNQDTYAESSMLFPLIRFGKYFTEGDKTLLPVAVFVKHAVADGYHTCKLINDMQEYSFRAKEWIDLP